MARVLFITGFNRSGTTLVTAAVTQAARASTLTVGDLAKHMPSVQRFLAAASKHGTVTDRGVDRLPVSESTPEEYGWLLNAVTGDFTFGTQAAQAGVLQSLVNELAGAGDATVVLKNPWDTGREQLLLDHFAGSRVLLVRRNLSAIEDSQSRAWDRMATSTRYVRALIGDPHRRAELLAAILDPLARQRAVRDARRRTRREAVRLARSVSKLPLDRVAFLSYDELRADPSAGASWASHFLDPSALGGAIAAHTFPEYNRASTCSLIARAIDWYWAWAWRRVRARQVKAGILTVPGRPGHPLAARLGR
jgi:Sulfotransferase family